MVVLIELMQKRRTSGAKVFDRIKAYVFKQKISEMIEASRNLIESKASVMIKQINALKEENEKIINKCIFYY